MEEASSALDVSGAGGAYVIGTGRAADRQKALDFGAQHFVDLDNEALEDVGGVDHVLEIDDGRISPNKPHDALPHGVSAFFPSLGMTNAQAITNVIAFAAEVSGVADRTGTLEVGKDADILAVAGDPLENVSDLHPVVAVYARGRAAIARLVAGSAQP